MSTPSPAVPASESLWLRLLRGAVALALALAVTIIAALVVLGCIPAVRTAFEPLFVADSKAPKLALAVAILFLVLLPALLLFWPLLRRALRGEAAAPDGAAVPGRERRGRFRWLSWPVLAVGWAVVLPVLVWLAADDPAVRQLTPIAEFAPVFPGAEQSYAVLMQYSKDTPGKDAVALAGTRLAVAEFPAGPQEPAKWVEFVAAHRDGFEADWNTLAPQRRWLDELAAFERIGDLTPVDLQPNIVTLPFWRSLAYHVCGAATAQALDGNGDEAVARLIPLLEVSRKLPLSSRTLLRSMMAEFTERLSLQTLAIVLDHATVSAGARARIGAALAPENAPEEAARLIMVDYVQFAPITFSLKLGDAVAPGTGVGSLLRIPFNLLSAFLINPNATMNLYGDHVRELAALAKARDVGRFAVATRDFGDQILLRPGIKNLGGRLLVDLSVPAYNKVLDAHWKNADLRAALRPRLAAAPAVR